MADEKLEISQDALKDLLTGEIETSENTQQELPFGIEGEKKDEESTENETKVEDESKKEEKELDKKKIDFTETKEKEVEVKEEDLSKEVDENSEIINESISLIQEKLGIEFTEEQLGTIELKGDLETIASITELAANVKAEKIFNDFIKDQPELYEYAMHIKAGGTKESYFNSEELPDLSGITIEKTDEVTQERWYRKFLQAKGNDKEEIEDLITLAKDKGVLYDKSVKGFDELKTHFDSQRDNKLKQDKEIVAKIEEERINTLKEMKSVISKGKLLNTNISKEEGTELFDYFTKPIDKSGITLRQKMWDELTLEQELLLENIVRKGFKGFIPQEEPAKKKVLTLSNLKKSNDGRTTKLGGEVKNDNFSKNGRLDIDQKELKDLLTR